AAGVPILGTSPDAIDRSEDRDRFKALVEELELRQPNNGIATSRDSAMEIAEEIGYPIVIRPSRVLGGRAMEIVHDRAQLERYIEEAVDVSDGQAVLLDSYLRDAVEVDVDALSDGENVFVCAIMEHIEEAGIHSGDSACVLPSQSLTDDLRRELERQTIALANALGVRGLMNIQFAIRDGEVYLLEVNPRASRTVPFVAKVIGVPIAGHAARLMGGEKLSDLGLTPTTPQTPSPMPSHVAVKEAVFPFARFAGVDPILGPEMRSTGEVIGLETSFAPAFAKSQLGAGNRLPTSG
ncbi:MAG: ATP-grasp domain-containing protein, partial [Pseudomonadota bacterium]